MLHRNATILGYAAMSNGENHFSERERRPRRPGGYFVSGSDIYALDGPNQSKSYIEIFIAGIRPTLEAEGIGCRTYRPWQAEGGTIIRAWDRKPPAFIISFNLNPTLKLGDKMIIDSLPTRIVCLLLDHPAHIAESFLGYARYREFRYGVMDPTHGQYLLDLGIPREHVFSYPQAGPEPTSDNPDFASREYGIVFFGGITDVETDKDFANRCVPGDPLAARALGHATERILDDTLDEDIVTSIFSTLVNFGFAANLSPVMQARLIKEIDTRARAIRRHRLFRSIADTKIDFFGNFAESFRIANPRGVFHPPTPFGLAIEIMRNARIAINDTINVRHAALIRFFYPIALGCLVATESNPFIATEFGNDAVHILDPISVMGNEALADCLHDRNLWERRVTKASSILAASHTWRHRAGALTAQLP